MDQLADNLRKLMWQFRISESELARRVGVSQPVIHRIAKGLTKNPNVDTLRPISRFFAVSMDQLVGDEPLPLEAISNVSPATHKQWSSLPLLTWRQAVFWEQLASEYKALHRFSTGAEVSDNAFALHIEEDAFLPLLARGSHIVVDPNLAPRHGSYVLAYYPPDDAIHIYRCLSGERHFRLQSIDPEKKMAPTWDACKIVGVLAEAKINFIEAATV
jgi:transcriptional regulator with XRE-family HTH domain